MKPLNRDEPLETRLAEVRDRVQGVDLTGGLRTYAALENSAPPVGFAIAWMVQTQMSNLTQRRHRSTRSRSQQPTLAIRPGSCGALMRMRRPNPGRPRGGCPAWHKR